MKLCVFSDSHGWPDAMLAAIGREQPALCFFLGDGERDLRAVGECFPRLPVYAVRGNCDLRSGLSAALVCTVGGVRIFAAHGHQYDVKYEPGLESLAAAARQAQASLVLYGHTHRARLEQRDGITFLNPGAVGRAAHPAYAAVTVEEGRFTAELKTV